ncbi:MAG: diguanylate cyclase [Proteobacteria bacterium]|nr:diguanylate cyclase [Pseudomonadota bacterium]
MATYQVGAPGGIHDSLTGLVNRSEFERRLRDCISARQRNGGQSFLAFLDLDQFKIVNDTCGHIAGDELLRQISTILATHMRATDTLARLGGDEFAILMGECSLRHAQTVMNRIREIIFDYRFPWEGGAFI